MKGSTIALAVLVIVAVFAAGYVFVAQSSKPDKTLAPQATTKTVSPTPMSDSSADEEQVAGGETRNIVVSGDEYSFSPAAISLKAGEKTKITFRNIGKLPHNLFIDELDVMTDTIAGDKETTVEVTAKETGMYTMYCGVGNHRALGMEGEVKIQ